MVTDPQFWAIFVPLIAAAIAWFANEASKRRADEYQRKESRYLELLAAARGFYVGIEKATATELRNRFLDSSAACWLYSPDFVIQAGYAYLRTVETGSKSTTQEKDRALGEFVCSIRRDVRGRRLFVFFRTSLTAQHYRHFTST